MVLVIIIVEWIYLSSLTTAFSFFERPSTRLRGLCSSKIWVLSVYARLDENGWRHLHHTLVVRKLRRLPTALFLRITADSSPFITYYFDASEVSIPITLVDIEVSTQSS